MAILVCKNCHNQFDPMHRPGASPLDGSFCTMHCENEYKARKERDAIQTIAQVSAAVELKKQTELMKQQQRQQQAQIARENAIRQAQMQEELAEACKKYRFSEDDAVRWMSKHEYSSIEEAVQKAKEEDDKFREKHKQWKENEEKKAKDRQSIDDNLFNQMPPEQQEKQKKINEVILNYKDGNKESDFPYIFSAIFAVTGVILYFVLRSKIDYVKHYGFWSTLLTFIGFSSILTNFITWSNYKKTIKRIAAIKGDDQYPSYNLSRLPWRHGDGLMKSPMIINIGEGIHSMNIGIVIFICIAVFKIFKYVHIPYVGVIAKILVILIPLIFFMFIYTKDEYTKKEKSKVEHKCKAYAEKKLGQFIWSV